MYCNGWYFVKKKIPHDIISQQLYDNKKNKALQILIGGISVNQRFFYDWF